MSCENELDCCPPDNLAYALPETEQVSVLAKASPPEAGTTSGSGLYDVNDSVTVETVAALPEETPVGTDIVFALDVSGSMQSIAADLIDDIADGIEDDLQEAGIGSTSVANRYGLLLFGWNDDHTEVAINLTDSATFLAALAAAIPGAVGGEEDGYRALYDAHEKFEWRLSSAVKKVIFLMTDEGRNNVQAGGGTQDSGNQEDDFTSIKATLVNNDYLTVGVVGEFSIYTLHDADNNRVFALDYTQKTYRKNGSGGHITGSSGDPNTSQAWQLDTFDPVETTTTADFTQPAVGSTVNVTVASSAWAVVGEKAGVVRGTSPSRIGGYYEITAVPDGTHVTLRNLGYSFNSAAGVNVASGAFAGTPWPVYPGGAPSQWIRTADAYHLLFIDSTVMGYLFDVFQYKFEDDLVTPASSNSKLSFTSALVPAIAEAIQQRLSWQFQGWYNEDGELVSTSNPYTFIVTADTVLIARYEREG